MPRAGVVGWWSGDGTAADISGNGNHGSARGITYGAGLVDAAFSFTENSAITIPASASLNVKSLTFTAWINSTGTNPQPIVEYGNDGEMAGAHLWVNTGVNPSEAGTLFLNLREEGTGSPHFISATNVIKTNQWSLVAVTYDYASGLCRLYVDGRMVQEANFGSLTPVTNKRLNLGVRPQASFDGLAGARFAGKLDEVQVFNRALSGSELLQMFNIGAAGQCKPEWVVPLQQATATFSQTVGADFVVSRAIDGEFMDNLGWGIYPEIRSQTAVFETVQDVGISGGSVFKFSLLFNHLSVGGSTGHTLGRFGVSVTTAARESFANGEPSNGVMGSSWTVLPILSATATSGATMTVLEDNSILVSGVLQPVDLYTVTATTRLTGITGIRLETLSDPSLPFNGPGREALNGNFVLSEFLVSQRAGGAPLIQTHPASITIAQGGEGQLSVAASSSLPIGYQWFRNGAMLNGQTNSTLVIANAALEDAGTYTVEVNNVEASTLSAPAVVTVNPVDSSNAATLAVSNRVPNSAPVSDAAGRLLSGSRYLAQVYVEGAGGVFGRVGPAVPFLSGADAGFFQAIELVLPTIAPGSQIRVQVRAWDSSGGPTYESAVLARAERGSSAIIETTTGGGGTPAPQLQGLASFSLVAEPSIVKQPRAESVLVGGTVRFTVEVSGSSPLAFQWRFNSNVLAEATSPALEMTNVQLEQGGHYDVIVSNPLGTVTSEPAQLTVLTPDITSPAVVISSPEAGVTLTQRVTFAGRISDDRGIASASWALNGQEQGALAEGDFSIANVGLVRGTNVFRVTARDTSGNVTTAVVEVTLEANRTISVGTMAPVQEGTALEVPINLKSRGDVSGISFDLNYDRNFLADPVVQWDSSLANGFTQSNTTAPGVVRASFALTGTSLPAGSQNVAVVTFRTRSVPGTVNTPLRLVNVSVFSATGEPLSTGTDVFSGSAQITRREYIGDNNGNDRLDVGDASIIMRLVNRLDLPRAWDAAANDLNKNFQLDVGDVIRVLRTIVGLDPQPGGNSPQSVDLITPATAGTGIPAVALKLDKNRAAPGETIKVTVELGQLESALSGASFRLDYPVAALRLESSAAHKVGPLVPANAVTLWNVAPAQNDYSRQDGSVSLAATTDRAWPSTNGVLAEFTFTVQAGATSQYLWPIRISQVELSSGFTLLSAAGTSAAVIGRDPIAASLTGASLTNGGFTITVRGEAGVTYLVEVSDDLKNWVELNRSSSASGQVEVIDPNTEKKPYRFYRATQIE